MSGVQVPSPPPSAARDDGEAASHDVAAVVAAAVATCLADCAARDEAVVVAYSGGPDSTALLQGLAAVAPRLGVRPLALHVDHGLDPGSAGRADAARRLAARLGVEATVARLDPTQLDARRRGIEDAARRGRYALLAEHADRHGARFVLTAHHADDQAETVLLRLLFGSGLDGLSGILPRHGRVLRPLLGLRRRQLAAALAASGLAAVDDPTNRILTTPRNRVRHRLLPRLEAAAPDVVPRLAALAASARRGRAAWSARLAREIDLAGSSCDLARLRRLEPPLRDLALGLLHRAARAPYPAPAAARRELARQLAAGGAVGCDCGHALRWTASGGRLHLDDGERGDGDGGGGGGGEWPADHGVYFPATGRVAPSFGRPARGERAERTVSSPSRDLHPPE